MVGGERKVPGHRDPPAATATRRRAHSAPTTTRTGCWVTDKLPFLGTAGVADRRYVELVPESPPAVLIDSAGSVPQR